MDSSPTTRLAGCLVLVLVLWGCGARESRTAAATDGAPDATPARMVNLEVGGMVCQSCVSKVEHQLAAVPGVRKVNVSLEGQRAAVTCDENVADTTLTAAVRRAGPDYVALVIRP